MQNMTTFFTDILQAVASFLVADPIIYLVGIILLLFVIKAFKMIIT